MEQLIKAFIQVCPLVLPKGVFNKLASGEAGVEGLVSEAVILQINKEVYIPFISKDVQTELVEAICKVFFTSSHLSDPRGCKWMYAIDLVDESAQ